MTLVVVLATLGLLVGIAAPAQASTFEDPDSLISYEFDETQPVKVATITDYTGHDTILDIPADVTIAGTTYKVTTIGDDAFRAKGLTSVTIPDSVTTIGSNAFFDNDLTHATIGSSVSIIGVQAFSANHLGSVVIPDSVTTIGGAAFRNNWIASVTIGDSVTTIAGFAFEYNRLLSVTIPASVTTIDTVAFANNPLLAEVRFLGDAPVSMVGAGEFGSFGYAGGKILYYLDSASGFSTPWYRYSTVALTTYTVSFDTGGGSRVPEATVISGDRLTTPADPTWTDHAFIGWYIDPAATTLFDFTSQVPGSLTLYAGWDVAALPPTGSAPSPVIVLAGILAIGAGVLLLYRKRKLTRTRTAA